MSGLFLLGGLGYAADIALSDGRVLKDAIVTSQSPRTVVIKHADGLSSVPKTLLSPELQAKYPVDEEAAKESERQATIARQAARDSEKDEAERVARLLAQREASASASEAAAQRDAAREETQ